MGMPHHPYLRWVPRADAVRDWLPELVARTGRSEQALLEKGLACSDFAQDSQVLLRLPPDMEVRIDRAFVLVRPSQQKCMVLSEHMGYIECQLHEGCEVCEQHAQSWYVHEAD